MATSAICGTGGTITGVTGATEVTQWTYNQEIDAQEATSMASSGWKERVACLKKGSGTFRTVGGAAAVGPYTATFKVATGKYQIVGGILVTEVVVETPVDGVVSFTHSFVSTGTITATLVI